MEFGLDPSLLFALIREESLFDPKAVSSAGAIGLTQVIPRTGRRIADELGHPDFGAGDLHNPGKSIQYGSFYLSQLVEEFEGRIDLALAAYNAGPHNVKRWIGGDSDPEREWFVESIPFWETRAYVKRVLSSLWVYSFLYQTRGD